MSKNHLIIGLGGTGGKIIRALRKTIYQEFRAVDPGVVNLEYLYVDSSDEMMGPDDPTWRVLGRSVQLGTNSQLKITDASLKTRLANINNYPGIKDWIGSPEEWANILNTIVGVTLGGQKRRLGRFLFACKAEQFKKQLQGQVRALQNQGEVAVTFHICCGLAGGTGSGSVIDVIAQVRSAYPDVQTYRIIVYALLPDKNPKPNWDTGNYHANGYAALMELNALSVGAFRPHDVIGGKGRLDLPDPFNGCYLFSNENDNGLFVDVETDIPDIMASFLYQKLVSVRNVQWDTLRRMESAENGDGSAETSDKVGERSKRFLTFGIKRLAIPEEEIREFLTFSFARQAALQLQYNNWSDAVSFGDEPRNQAFQAYVVQQDTQERWLLSDDHLRLSKGILEDERRNTRWKPINNTWQDILPQFKLFIRENFKNNPKDWLDQLSKLCQKRYEEEYRELGVVRFYETKEKDRKDHLREIRGNIERDLMEAWKNGTYSMYDIRRILEALLASLQARFLTADDKIVKATQNEADAAQRVDLNAKTWSKIGAFAGMLGKRDQLFDAQATCLQEQYIFRTYIHAWRFAKGLLQALIGELSTLQSEVDACASMIAEATEEFNRAIAARCNDEGETDLKQQLVKFYQPETVKDFARVLVRDKDEQFKQTKAVRDALLEQLGERPTFGIFRQRMAKEKFIHTLEAKCEENAQQAHDLLIEDNKDRARLLGDSIIDRLYQRYAGSPEEMQRYIRELVHMAGNYLSFQGDEVSKVGEGIPANVPTRISSFTVIMPTSSAHPEFTEALRRAFRAHSAVQNMEFIPSQEIPCEVRPNEITLLSVTNLFPLRFVAETGFLRQKYEARIKGPNAARAKMELHSEGDGTQFPRLFVPDAKIIIEEGLPYILLGKALDVIQSIQNPVTGAKSLAMVTKDKDGFDNDPVVLGATLVDSVSRLDPANVRSIRYIVEERLSSDQYAHQDRKTEVQKAVLKIVEDIKMERGSNVEDLVYQRFLTAGRSAVAIVKPKG